MFFRYNFNRKFLFSKISQSLKILELKQPITQKQIKTKYKQLAKKYHPDSLTQKKSTKQLQEKFVKITVAYNELKDLDQTVLNQEEYDINIPEADRERVKTQDEINRQKTYEYFNSRTTNYNYKPNVNIDTNHIPNSIPKKKKPLYKTVPQLFIGAAFVFILMAQWLHKTRIQTNNNKQKVIQQHQKKLYQNVFKGFNYKKNFSLAQTLQPENL